MDTLPLELLFHIADYLDVASVRACVLTCRRHNVALRLPFYSKAASCDRETGWPLYLLHAVLLDRASDALRGLLQATDLGDINRANICVEDLPEDTWERVQPGQTET